MLGDLGWHKGRVEFLELRLRRNRQLLEANAMDAVVLEQALYTYACHRIPCPRARNDKPSYEAPCSCGLGPLLDWLGQASAPGSLADIPGCGLQPDPDNPGRYIDPA